MIAEDLTWSHKVLHGLTRSYMVSQGLTWCHKVLNGVTYGVIWCHMVSHGVTWCHMVSKCLIVSSHCNYSLIVLQKRKTIFVFLFLSIIETIQWVLIFMRVLYWVHIVGPHIKKIEAFNAIITYTSFSISNEHISRIAGTVVASSCVDALVLTSTVTKHALVNICKK